MDDHYKTLGLLHRRADSTLIAQDFKQAYRKALLQHHPDKAAETSGQQEKVEPAHPPKYTVDQISVAFKTLSDPTAKAEYDRKQALGQIKDQHDSRSDSQVFYSGLDTVDLDDLEYDDASNTWSRACRCGQERGYLVTEHELEKHALEGELFTGCRGCSLWLKILFGVEEAASIAETALNAESAMPE